MTDTTLQNMEIYVKSEEAPKKSYDAQMTSSTISTISSLASPVDSGVQLLDSESELTSAMSNLSGKRFIFFRSSVNSLPDAQKGNFKNCRVIVRKNQMHLEPSY